MDNIAIVWFRTDLRLHDNEALTEAILKAKYVVPVYVFDPRITNGKTTFGFDKTAKFRMKFILESVKDLRDSLRKCGSDLIIRFGKPEDEIFSLAKQLKTSWVYCNRDRMEEEVSVQDALERNLWSIGQELRYTRGKMLLYTSDLPFPIAQVPDVFSAFRKEIEGLISIRQPFSVPEVIPFPENFTDRGELPTLFELGKDVYFNDRHIENQLFKGGETKALQQLQKYIWVNQNIKTFKETRNEIFGWEFSTKFSAWLAIGCLSPKLIVSELKKFENEIVKNDSTYLLFFELLWRDFFRLMGKKYEKRIFQVQGIRGILPTIYEDTDKFDAWSNGKTGIPFIDAFMRQLNETGYISSKGRLIVASFLVKDLKQNWVKGAEYFESMLIDYDPCSNYGNWSYIAGVGSDPKEDRSVNVLAHGKRYDSEVKFIKYWIPELAGASAVELLEPVDDKDICIKFKNYTAPIIPFSQLN